MKNSCQNPSATEINHTSHLALHLVHHCLDRWSVGWCYCPWCNLLTHHVSARSLIDVVRSLLVQTDGEPNDHQRSGYQCKCARNMCLALAKRRINGSTYIHTVPAQQRAEQRHVGVCRHYGISHFCSSWFDCTIDRRDMAKHNQ